MAFFDSTSNPDLPTFFNVTTAVGKGAPNAQDDVALVQYYLLKIYALPGWTRPHGNMTLDGVCGPITSNWILKFQLDVRSNRRTNVLPDGRVDRMLHHPGRTVSSSISGTLYTICDLNRLFQMFYPDDWSVLRTANWVSLPVLQDMYAASMEQAA